MKTVIDILNVITLSMLIWINIRHNRLRRQCDGLKRQLAHEDNLPKCPDCGSTWRINMADQHGGSTWRINYPVLRPVEPSEFINSAYSPLQTFTIETRCAACDATKFRELQIESEYDKY